MRRLYLLPMQASATRAEARYDALAVSSNRWHLRDLRRAAATGKWINRSQATRLRNDVGKQHIDAQVLRELLEDPGAIEAVRLHNFYIDGTDGPLALADVSFAGELALESCEIGGDIDLTRGTLGAVRIVKSSIRGSIRASGLSVSRWLILDDTTISGAVLAPDATIDGRVSCDRLTMGIDSFGRFKEVSLLLECATIEGRFSARNLRAAAQVILNGARLAGQLDLRDAHLRGSPVALSAKNVHVADVAHINGSEKKGPFRADGQVLVTSSEFAGGLNCNRMHIESPHASSGAPGVMFDARNAKIGGEFFLNLGTIVGGVLLTAADVRGQFNLSGLKIHGQPEAAIAAQGMRVGTDIWLNEGLEASSAVLLDRAEIGGTVNAVAGRFIAGERPEIAHEDTETANDGIALSLASASIGGSLVLGDEPWTAKRDLSGFRASGTVILTDTHVADRLEAAGGTFDGCGGDALRADGIRVDTDMRLASRKDKHGHYRFEAYGAVRLSRATIAGSLDLTGALLTVAPRDGGDPRPAASASETDASEADACEGHAREDDACALDASLARVGDRLVLRELVKLKGCVSLSGAQVGMLSDDKSYWLECANTLKLDDFRYGRLNRDWLDWRAGSMWLSRLHRYSAQPYLELARVERLMGRTRDARRLNIERHKARLNTERDNARLSRQRPASWPRRAVRTLNSLTRFADRALGLLTGWGYARWRLAPIWAMMLLVALTLFHWAGSHNLMRPSHPPLLLSDPPESARCTSEYPCFEFGTYSLDVILPVVELNQRDNWYADSRTARGQAIAITTVVLTLLGWAFATLLAASFTNVLKRE